MQTRPLGRTGLQVSAFGLGTGGGSRLGLARGASEQHAEAVVRRALELGISYIDTAPAYGTEEVVGRALSSVKPDDVVVSTKVQYTNDNAERISGADLRSSVERSLRLLGASHVDVCYLHGVPPEDYGFCLDALAPTLVALRDAGDVRAVGVTEAFQSDPSHAMLQRALEDACWDVMMAGFNILNPSVRNLLPTAAAKGVGVVAMHAVRWMLTSTTRLRGALDRLAAEGADSRRLTAASAKVSTYTDDGVLPEAAYAFAVNEPGIASVLIGTGDLEHLEQNARATTQPAPALAAELEGLLEGRPPGSGDDPDRR